MNLVRPISLLLLACTFLSLSISAQPKEQLPVGCESLKEDVSDIENMLDRWMEWRIAINKIPGISFGLVCGEDLILEKSFGYTDLESKSNTTPETLYRIASITKVFTAMAVIQLRDQGKLALSDPITKHLSWVRFENSDEFNDMTIHHLLTHSAGIPTNSAATDFNTMTQPDLETVKNQISSQTVVFEPGTTYKYSNLGFALLGALIAEVSGVSYNTYIRENLLKPLGMNTSLVHPTIQHKVATGYSVLREDGSRRAAKYQDLAYSTPAGGMASNVIDISKFITFQLNPEPYSDVLSKESVMEMQQFQWEIPDTEVASGYSWFVDKRNDLHQVSHAGGLPFQTAQLQIDLTNNLGVIVMTNAQDGEPAIYADEILSIARLSLNRKGIKNNSLKKYTGHFKFREWEAHTVLLGDTLYLVYSLLSDRISPTFIALEPTDEEHEFIMRGGPNPGEEAVFRFDDKNLEKLITPGFYFDAVSN